MTDKDILRRIEKAATLAFNCYEDDVGAEYEDGVLSLSVYIVGDSTSASVPVMPYGERGAALAEAGASCLRQIITQRYYKELIA